MDNTNRDANKSPDQLRREAGEQRSDLQQTWTELARRFMPSEVVDQLLGYARGGGGELSRTVLNSIRSNPLPALLTAAGLAWMLLGQNRSQGRGDRGYLSEDDLPTSASYGPDPDYDPRLRSQTGERARQTRAGFERLLRDQPIAVGVIGAALGALLAASLPRSRQEDELLAGARERMTETASGLAGRARAEADNIGRHIYDKAQDSSSSSDPSKTH